MGGLVAPLLHRVDSKPSRGPHSPLLNKRRGEESTQAVGIDFLLLPVRFTCHHHVFEPIPKEFDKGSGILGYLVRPTAVHYVI